jgi:hypothetical protein
MKSEDDLKEKVNILEGEYREKLDESTESAKSLKEVVLMFLSKK